MKTNRGFVVTQQIQMKKCTLFFSFLLLLVLVACAIPKEEQTGETRVVEDIKGTVAIPVNPKRIVDLSGNSDVLALLELPVVGTANSDAYDYTKLPSYLEEVLKDAKILGYSYQDTMDIENIMSVHPDLIIISTVQEKMYDTLSEIAPTLMIELDALDWTEDIKALAQLLDKESVADEWLANYYTKAKLVEDEIKDKLGSDTSHLSFLASSGTFFIFSNAGFGSVLYSDLNLPRPKGLPEQSTVTLPVVTYEGLAAIEADFIFVVATENDIKELEKNSIWNNLPAVKNNQVVVLPSSPYFNQGYSPIGRLLILDEIVELIDGISN